MAVVDLDETFKYISRDSPDAAGKIVRKIVNFIGSLRDNPLLGKNGRVPLTRELVISGTHYIAVYRIKDNCLEILRVLHGARKWPNRL